MEGLTCIASGGFGAQYQACLSGLAYARHTDRQYIHSCFTEMDHGIDASVMNRFTGLRSDNWTKMSNAINLFSDNFIDEVHWAKKPSVYYNQKVLVQIRDLYYSVRKPDVEDFDIAIGLGQFDNFLGFRFILFAVIFFVLIGIE